MMQDERLQAALARLTEALASLETAAGKIRSFDPFENVAAPDPSGALEHAVAKAAKLEAANEEVSRVLKIAIEALAAIASR